MAVIDIIRPSFRFNSLISGFMGGLAARKDARNTRISLSRLNDRELNDIGLLRSEIDSVATLNLMR